MIYHLKGLVARFLDIFDPDEYSYVVPEEPDLTLYYHHVKDYARDNAYTTTYND